MGGSMRKKAVKNIPGVRSQGFSGRTPPSTRALTVAPNTTIGVTAQKSRSSTGIFRGLIMYLYV